MATFSASFENGFGETDFDHEDVEPSFFYGLKQRDKDKRTQSLEQISKVLGNCCSHKDDEFAKKLLAKHLPTVLRLSTSCPFLDVRNVLGEALEKLENSGIKVPKILHEGCSSFIPECSKNVFISKDEFQLENSAAGGLFVEAFFSQLRVSHTVQLFGYHPKYLTCLLRTINALMRGDGPLPYPVRHYIAILAASRHCCSYLVSLQEAEFLEQNGDPTWLLGLDHIPTKIYKLLHLNKLLAHQPWKIAASMFADLLVGPDSFSLGELVHAIVIMTHYHALASFALGCGVNPEIDTPLGCVYEDGTQPDVVLDQGNPALGVTGTPSDSEVTDSDAGCSLSPVRRKFSSGSGLQGFDSHSSSETPLIQTLQYMKDINFDPKLETKESLDREFQESLCSKDLDPPCAPKVTPQNLRKYIEDPNYAHEDIESRGTLNDAECSWEDHVFPLIDRLYSDMGFLLDEKFRVAFSLTYYKVGEKDNVKTEEFRRAIWQYIQAINGIRHDDYNYREVNVVLDKGLKTFIRMVACYPEQVTQYDFNKKIEYLGLIFTEKIHINLLVLEAKLQAELLYAFRALMQYMKQ